MPHKTKVAMKTMLEACQIYLSGKASYDQIAESLGVGRTSVRRWVRKYESEGADGLAPQESNRVYSPETKLLAVMEYLNGTSVMHLCAKYHIRDEYQLRHWIKQYNSHEEFKPRSGGSRIMTKRKTTQDERKAIVQYCLEHDANYGETAKVYKISYHQVYQWVKKYKEMGEAGLEDRRGHRIGSLPSRTKEEELRDQVAELKRKNHLLQMENDFLKKLKELERRDALAQHASSANTKRWKR